MLPSTHRVLLNALLIGMTVMLSGLGVLGRTIQVPFGKPISDSALDGVLGKEWGDATSSTARLEGYASSATCRVDYYVKHDGDYLYFAVRSTETIRGRNIGLWIVFDADNDGRWFRRGDDSLVLYDTNGRLDNRVDHAYTSSTPSLPKEDRRVGGRSDKVGAGSVRSTEYVFETRIKLDSGDAAGNDLSLSPGNSISFSFGLMTDQVDLESPEYSLELASIPCLCSISAPSLVWCKGQPIQFVVRNLTNQDCDFFSCSVSPFVGIPEAPLIDSGTIWGLRPGQSSAMSWDQKDSGGTQVPPGSYCISCGCSTTPFCFSIVECGRPPGREPSPIPEPPPYEPLLPPFPSPSPGEDTSEEAIPCPDCKEPPIAEDTFDNVDSGWPQSESMGYDLGREEYYIASSDAFEDTWAVSSRGPQRSSFCFTARARPTDDETYGIYGLVFGYRDDENFYLFTVSTDGYYSLHKREDGEFSTVLPHQREEAIEEGDGMNVLSVVSYQGHIWLYINRQPIDSVSNESPSRGAFGFFAAQGLHVQFDDYEVRNVDPG